MKRRAAFSSGSRARFGVLFIVGVLILSSCSYFPPNISINETTSIWSGGPGAGFDNPQNVLAWSMAWFKGKLYVGTEKNDLCLTSATLAFYEPAKYPYTTNPQPGVTCPADRYDFNTQAEIWRYDPSNPFPWARWSMVYRSPADIPNPREDGKFVAEEVGFRNMIVYTDPKDPTHTPALYVAATTADEYIPELQATHPPHILRSTDGIHFRPIGGSPGQVQYDLSDGRGVISYYPMGYRAMAAYNGRLFITASPDMAGDGVIMEIDNPAGPNPTWTQVSPPDLNAYELEVFNHQLYVGAGSYKDGYGVLRTDASGAAPFHFTPVVTGGAGRGSYVTSVVSMDVFQGRLYVGSSGWFNELFPASEMIRISPDDTWQLVAGNPRQVTLPDGTTTTMNPISGFPDGFGNPFTAHFWRMQEFNNGLLVGTNDWSYILQWNPLPFLRTVAQSQYGYDIYGSCDGQYWWLGTPDAFGDGQFNFGARTIVASPDGLNVYIGSTNHNQGANVWKLTNTTPFMPLCPPSDASATVTPAAAAGTASQASSPMPSELEADVQSCGTVLSWAPAQGASNYRVLRSEFHLQDVTVSKPPRLPGTASVPDVPATTGPKDETLHGKVWIPGPALPIGTTTQSSFVDRSARQGVYYAYSVQAVDGRGNATYSSNAAFSPSQAPEVSFNSVIAAIRDKANRGKIQDGGVGLLELVSQAQTAAARGDQNGAVNALDQALASLRNSGQNIDSFTAQDLSMSVSDLQRQTRLASVGCAWRPTRPTIAPSPPWGLDFFGGK